MGGRYLRRRYVEGRQSSSASDNKNSQSIFFNGHLGAHVGFYDLAGKPLPHNSFFHLKLMSAAISNNCFSKSQWKTVKTRENSIVVDR